MKPNEINTEELAALATALGEYFPSKQELNKFVSELRDKPVAAPGDQFSITRVIRGVYAQKGHVIAPETAEADVAYTKALNTGSTPGSVLIPDGAQDRIVELSATYGVLRRSGPSVVPMAGQQKLRVPRETVLPVVSYIDQGVASNESEPGYESINLDLRTRRGLVICPNELLRRSVPAIDRLIERGFAKSLAQHEDQAFFAGIADGPLDLDSVPGMTEFSQAGAALAFSDFLTALAESEVKGVTNPVWFVNTRVFYTKILNLRDDQNRPIVLSDLTARVPFNLLGFPVYRTSHIPTNTGSPANKSWVAFLDPANILVGDSGIEIAASSDRYFERNATGIRAVSSHDFGYGQPSEIVMMNDVV